MIPAPFVVERLRLLCSRKTRRFEPNQKVLLRRLVTDIDKQALRLVSESGDGLDQIFENEDLTCLGLFSCTVGGKVTQPNSVLISFTGKSNRTEVALIRAAVNGLYQTTLEGLDEPPQIGIHHKPVSATIALIGEDNMEVAAYLCLHRHLRLDQGVALLWDRFHSTREDYYMNALVHSMLEH